MAVTHTFVSPLPDDAADAAAGLVVSSNWNADHAIDSIEITGGTVTASTPLIDATQTWNNAAVTFTASKVNVTDTASASGSLLADWQVGGVSKVSIIKDGTLNLSYSNSSLQWEAADGKGFAFGFSEGVTPDDNHIWNAGFNIGAVADVTEPTLFLSMESNYDAGADNYMEYHLNYIPVGGGGGRRPFSVDINRATDNIRFNISGEPIWFSTADGSRQPVTWSFTGDDGNPLQLIDDIWGATGTDHYGIRYVVDATAGGTGTLLSLETSTSETTTSVLFAVLSNGHVGIGNAATADQLLSVSSSGIAGFNVKTTAAGEATLTFSAFGSTNVLVAENSSTGRLQVKMSSSGSPMLDIDNKALRLGYDNYNGTTTTSVWDGTASTGVTTLAIREGAGQSSSDYLTVYTGGWTTKKASINPSGIYYYGAYTDGSNYVRGSMSASSTEVTLSGETAGTGADNIDVKLVPAGAGRALSTTTIGIANAANGQACEIKTLTELLTIAAAATSTTTIQKPANSIILAVPVRVTTAVTCTSTFTVGDAGSATRFSTAAVSKAATSTDKGTAAGAYYNATAEGIVITPDTVPSDATGRVRVTIYYIELTPPTS